MRDLLRITLYSGFVRSEDRINGGHLRFHTEKRRRNSGCGDLAEVPLSGSPVHRTEPVSMNATGGFRRLFFSVPDQPVHVAGSGRC